LVCLALELQVVAQENLALNKPVISSGPNWGSFKPAALSDGDPNSFTHPLADSGTLGFYYQIDLGRSYRFDRIVLRNRNDGCCPERLSKVRIEIYADGGDVPGPLTWNANVRADGSNSGVGGTDTITAANNPGSTFAGRFVRVVNASDASYNPQLAEIEVFGGLTPVIRLFNPDEDVISAGQGTYLRWEIDNATSAAIAPGIGVINPTNGVASVAPLVTTTFTLSATNDNGGSIATTVIGVNVLLAPPDLTEFLADNAGGLKDEDGNASDWIELQNPNSFGLGVGGYFLTDDPADLKKWPLPAVRIPANGSLIVFASGEDRRDPRGTLHTNFKLDAKGDFLALVDRDGTTVLRQYPADYPPTPTFPKQGANVSYGIGSNNRVGYFRPPTPGATNGPAFAGVVADIEFSRDHGFYDTNIAVAITTETSGAAIRYTTNRTAPTATSGAIYSGPIPISKTTILRAAAFKEGWAPTAVSTRTYVFPTNIITSSVMRQSITTNAVYGPQMRAALLDLPSISLVTTANFNDTSEVQTSIEWLRPDGQPGFQEDCGVRIFGGAFTDFAKKSFRVYFKSEFGAPKLKYPVFAGFEHGLAAPDEFDQLELRGGSHDMVMRGFYMSNIAADDTLLELGQLNPHGRFVHVYLNGTYWGVYHLRERWGAAMHQSYLGGSRTNYESINGNWNVGGWAEPGTPYDGDGSAWARVKSLRKDYRALKPWLDVPQFTDFMLTWIYGRCEDEYRCVGPTVPGSGFKFYLNDADGFFQSPANPWYGEPSNRTARGSPGRQPGDGPGSLFSMLLAEGHPDYRTLLADRIFHAFYQNGALTPARVTARLSERCQEIERAFLAEAARWNYRTPSNWAAVRDDVLHNWLPSRTGAVLGQLRAAGFYPSLDAPVLNQPGGLVADGFTVRFSSPAGSTVYFTVDGNDPRLPGGAVAPAGQSYNTGGGSLPVITRNTVLKCRAKNGTQWSALNEAFFQVGPSALDAGEVVVTEINFHPPGQDGTEFVEMANLSTRAVNLRGARFLAGIDYAFPDNRDTLLAPGQRLVLVNDLFRFQQRYGRDVPVAGVFAGNLSNHGERLTFTTASSNVLSSFQYDVARSWLIGADGGGYTLVLAQPQLGLDDPAAWRTSATTNGTPGGTDATLFAGDPLADTDQDGLSALVEYALGTSDTDPSSGPGAIIWGFDPQGSFTLGFPRNLRADDVTLRAEFSIDLLNWIPADLRSIRSLGDGTALQTWGVSESNQPVLFLRLVISRP
jgi:hypothetical protein